MASVSELACIYLAFTLHIDEVTVTALANVNIGSLICNVGAGGPAPAAGATGGPAPSATAAPAEEKKVEAKKEESEESDDDMGFGLFD
ncbi:60S acidic ribosomal protein P1-like isoform X1 [Neophocaena asiaeorientalis asiaeorientalis]|uniref:60S acidic ribosomal protein P1-like isoform X1 n=1 Tax=Neophocaena asiaeorientalis asiaeorientalis TaxID=1706337 RepID=A0A341CGD0_NEOAA|nr:60S acidic ribosomal protein P1-like isoform X1 [Neophocaena asiaeorientalis asiaeorientalis]